MKWTIKLDGQLKYHNQVDAMHGRTINLVTPGELNNLPDGTILYSIFGERVIKGQDKIDDDTRGGYLAYGLLEETIQ